MEWLKKNKWKKIGVSFLSLLVFVGGYYLVYSITHNSNGCCVNAPSDLLSAPGDAALITGQDRKNFVQILMQSCVETQRSQNTANLSVETINNFCTCYSNGFADRMTLGDVKIFGRATNAQTPAAQVQSAFQSRIDEVSAACIQAINPQNP